MGCARRAGGGAVRLHCAESGRAGPERVWSWGRASASPGPAPVPAVAAGSGNGCGGAGLALPQLLWKTGAGLRAGLPGGKRVSPFPRVRRNIKLHAEVLCLKNKKIKNWGEDVFFLAEPRWAGTCVRPQHPRGGWLPPTLASPRQAGDRVLNGRGCAAVWVCRAAPPRAGPSNTRCRHGWQCAVRSVPSLQGLRAEACRTCCD